MPRHSRVKKSGEWFKDVTISLLGRSFNSAVDALVVRCGGRGFWKRRSLRRERGDLLAVFLLHSMTSSKIIYSESGRESDIHRALIKCSVVGVISFFVRALLFQSSINQSKN